MSFITLQSELHETRDEASDMLKAQIGEGKIVTFDVFETAGGWFAVAVVETPADEKQLDQAEEDEAPEPERAEAARPHDEPDPDAFVHALEEELEAKLHEGPLAMHLFHDFTVAEVKPAFQAPKGKGKPSEVLLERVLTADLSYDPYENDMASLLRVPSPAPN